MIYKLVRVLLFHIVFPFCLCAQMGTWTWVKGVTTPMSPGNYGTMGVPSPTNEPPGRYACSHWEDTSGRFWIYGAGFSDLWMFDPVTNMWTFMKGDTTPLGAVNITAARGVFNATNSPGETLQGKATWVTPDSHLWLLGNSSNLWQYDPAINQWAWMGATGPVNYGVKGMGTAFTLPGDRVETSTAWTDNNGNLWLFGGDLGGLSVNDMWEYNVATGIWTWMSGTNLTDNAGNYGTQGLGSVNNIPPARSVNTSWKDSAGNFWLAGGEAIDQSVYYQDVWQFNPQNLEWTWMSGTQGPDASAPTGSACIASSTNKQGKRWENRAVWKVCDNLIVNYSGQSAAGPANYYNDLWAYVPSLGQWMLLTSGPQAGNYGIQGVASASNFPPGRVGAVGFIDRSKNLWMFGGTTFGGNWFNDLWKYVIDTACTSVANCYTAQVPPNPLQVNITSINDSCYGTCNGSALAIVASGTSPYHYLWQPGNDTTAAINNLCAGTYTVTVTDSNHLTMVDSVIITQPQQLLVSGITDSAKCNLPNGSAQIIVSGGNKPYSYQWSPAVSDSSSAVGLSIAHYLVTITDSTGCRVTDSISIFGKDSVTRPYLGVDTFICPGNEMILLNAGMFLNYFWQDSSVKQYFSVTDSGTYWVVVTDSNGCKASDSIVVAERCNTLLVVPNAFTPNGDGKNDFFKPLSIDMPVKFSMHVYNRWGQLVFESNNITDGWDGNFKGKPQPVGTYIYYIQYTFTGQKEQGVDGLFELLR